MARPITSASFVSSFVNSAITLPLRPLVTLREPRGERLGQARRMQLALRFLHGIWDAVESAKPAVEIEQQVGGTRIAVARLADRPRIEQPAGSLELVTRAVGSDAAAQRAVRERNCERDVAVADQGDVVPGIRDRRCGRLRGEHVLPDRVAGASVVEGNAGAPRLRLERREE